MSAKTPKALEDALAKWGQSVRESYTPEQIEFARQKQAERLAGQMGLCSATCQICGGVGYVRLGNGKVEYCPNVDIWRLPQSKLIGLSKPELESMSFDNILPIGNITKAVEAVDKVITRGFGWVYLWGSWGVGKTLLLKNSVASVIRLGAGEARYARFATILDHLRQGFDNDTELSRLNDWAGVKLLAVDEFDRVRDTEYAQERRFMLFDLRYEQALAKQGITLFASNQNPQELPGYLFDRVRDGRFTTIKIEAPSIRPGLDWEAQDE